MASPLALRLGAVSDPPGCKCTGLSLLLQFALSQHLCKEKSSVCQACLSPHCSASEGKTEGQASAPDLPQPKPLADMKWRCGFQPVPSSVPLAGGGHPQSSRNPGQAHPLSGKPEDRAEGLAAASPAQIRVFSQGSDLCVPKLIVGCF